MENLLVLGFKAEWYQSSLELFLSWGGGLIFFLGRPVKYVIYTCIIFKKSEIIVYNFS